MYTAGAGGIGMSARVPVPRPSATAGRPPWAAVRPIPPRAAVTLGAAALGRYLRTLLPLCCSWL